MSDIDSKKDNSIKIGDYGKKLGSSIFKFCMLILIGCIVLYASKACGTGILDVIIQTYYIKGLTDDFLVGPVKPCQILDPETEGNLSQSGGDPNDLNTQTTNVEDGQYLNPQYINRIKVDDNLLYQKISFSPNPDIQESAWSSLNKQLNKIREEIKKNPGNKNPPKAQTPLSCFDLFITGIISNVTIFNLKLLNSFFKFLNNRFPDSATIIFGPFIAAIVLFIIAIISIFVTGYYIVYNSVWLVLNTPSEVYDENDELTWNSHNFINGVPIFYKPWKKLLYFPWIWWMGWCLIVGYAIAFSIMPVSMIITIYILLRWIIYLLFLPSTYDQYDKPCSVFSMFLDTFTFKRQLISSIMSLIVISTSFDVFDNTGGAIAIIVCLLIYFKIIFKFELFDEYIPEPDSVEMSSFVEKPEMKDFVPECVIEYADVVLDDTVNKTVNGNNSNTTNKTTDVSDSGSILSSLVKNKDKDSGAIEMSKIIPPVPDATDVDSGAIEMSTITPTLSDATKDATKAATDAATKAAIDAVSDATKLAQYNPEVYAATQAASLAANSGLVPPINIANSGLVPPGDIEMKTLNSNPASVAANIKNVKSKI